MLVNLIINTPTILHQIIYYTVIGTNSWQIPSQVSRIKVKVNHGAATARDQLINLHRERALYNTHRTSGQFLLVVLLVSSVRMTTRQEPLLLLLLSLFACKLSSGKSKCIKLHRRPQRTTFHFLAYRLEN